MHNIKVRFRLDFEGVGCVDEPSSWIDITSAISECDIKDVIEAFLDDEEGEGKRHLVEKVENSAPKVEEYLTYIGYLNKYSENAVGYNIDFHNIQSFADYLLQERKEDILRLLRMEHIALEELNTILDRSSNTSLNLEIVSDIKLKAQEERNGPKLYIALADNLFLKTPYDKYQCDYVCFEDSKGEELAYWDSNEWAERPKEVMGAILRCIANRRKFSLKAGDYITWIDPDRESPCDKINLSINFIEHHSNGESCSIVFEDGTELECYYEEIKID